MRIVFAWPFSFTPASRMLDSSDDAIDEPLADLGGRAGNAEIAGLGYREAGIAARINGGEGAEVHVYVKCQAMVCAAAHDTYAERRYLGTVHIDPGGTCPPRGARADKVDHRLLEQAHEFAHLDTPAREVHERVEHHLAGAVIGHFAAAVRGDHGDAVGHLHRSCALAQRVHRRMLEQPELVRRLGVALEREPAHRLPGRRIVDGP